MVYANFEIDKHFFCNCTVICIDRYFFFANCPNQTFLIRTNLEEHDLFGVSTCFIGTSLLLSQLESGGALKKAKMKKCNCK